MIPVTEHREPVRHLTSPELAPIFRLADNLDATLAMAEDLLRQSIELPVLVAGDTQIAIVRRHRALVRFARSTRALELAMTARILQARVGAIGIRAGHVRFAGIIGLFIGGTAPLADAAAGLAGGLGDVSSTALLTGPQVLHYLTSRGIVAAETFSLAALTTLAVTEDYRVAEGVPLGPLMDMIAQFLDSLDLAFDLYQEPHEAA